MYSHLHQREESSILAVYDPTDLIFSYLSLDHVLCHLVLPMLQAMGLNLLPDRKDVFFLGMMNR